MATKTEPGTVVVQHDGSVRIPSELLEQAGINPGDQVFFWTNGQGKLHLRLLPMLSPEDLYERYGNPEITEVDWPKVREEAEAAAADEFVASMRRHG